MKFKSIVAAAAVAMGMAASSQAGAVTYQYTGNTLPSAFDIYTGNPLPPGNYHVTGTADLNCGGPCYAGNYIEGGNLISFTLTAFDSFNNVVLSMSNADAGYTNDGFVNYLKLNGSGVVTNWNILIDSPAGTPNIVTAGNDNVNPFSGTSEGFVIGSAAYYSNDSPGSWNASATPLPAALPMFATGLGVMGWLAKRRKRKATLAIATA